MKTKLLICTLAATISVCGLITSETFAADNSATTPLRGMILQRIVAKLNLTAAQESQIKAILAADKDTLVPLLGELHETRAGLRAAIHASGATANSVRSASAKVAVVEANLAVERLKLYGEIMPVLTPEQQQTISGLEQSADEFVDNAIAQIGVALTN